MRSWQTGELFNQFPFIAVLLSDVGTAECVPEPVDDVVQVLDRNADVVYSYGETLPLGLFLTCPVAGFYVKNIAAIR